MIHKDDIELAREIIKEKTKDTPFGKATPLGYCLLRHAIDSVEDLQRENEALRSRMEKLI